MAKPILVVIFLRGGCDGLNLIGPSADPIYIQERSAELRVERTGDHPAFPLRNTFADGDFRLHFKAPQLKQLYDSGQLAIVHACGLTNGTRSHFEAQDYMERGTPDNKSTSTGWLTRLVQLQKPGGMVPVVSASGNLPASLLACPQAIAVTAPRSMQLNGGGRFRPVQQLILQRQYQGSSAVDRNGYHVLEVVDIFAGALPRNPQGGVIDYTPAKGVTYDGELGNGLRTVAQLIKMDVGVEIAAVDYGGWDTHVDQGGRFNNQTDNLSRSIGAFWDDMSAYHDQLTLVVMSEFGRRLKSNESHGTDHGHGNMMLVLGGMVKGNNIYGRWPGLANEALDNQVDLAITTDYRLVLAEILAHRFSGVNLKTVFPGFDYSQPLGFIRA